MKKSGLLLTAAAVLGVMLTGCASKAGSAFSPSASCVYVAQNGSLSSALVKEYEGEAVDEKDLKQYLEAAVIRFNQENGAEGAAENQQGVEPLPVAIQSVKAEKGRMTAVFDYSSLENLIQFRQSDDNEDNSNTITSLEVKKMTDAVPSGWLDGLTFVKTDGSSVTIDEMKKELESTVVSLEGGGNVMFSGKILYMTEGTEKKDEYTVTLPDGGSAFVVFK